MMICEKCGRSDVIIYYLPDVVVDEDDDLGLALSDYEFLCVSCINELRDQIKIVLERGYF